MHLRRCAVVLPSPDSLSLPQAVTFVEERCDCSEDEAKKALRRAGIDGRLAAFGEIPLSVHPDPNIRARHRVRKSEDLRPVDWNGNIDWIEGTVGPYFSVSIKRSSIEAWLEMGREAESSPTLKPANKSKINATIKLEYDKAESANEKPPNVREIAQQVQKALRLQGLDASLNRIQELAGAQEFRKRRRKPGVTVRSEKRRQEG
jgi:hypothetical protein